MAKLYAQSGRDIWSYSIFLKQNRPYQYRHISWQHFAYGFGGPATFYTIIDSSSDPFNSYDGNGQADYGAMYEDVRTGLASVSLRMEAWYQGHIELRLLKWCRMHIDGLGVGRKAAFASRLDDLVKSAIIPRADFDALSRELLALSDRIADAGSPRCAKRR